MPKRAARPCAYPGCPELVREGSYCAQHSQAHQQHYERQRGSAASRGYDARWRRIRKMFLNSHPLCADPYQLHPGQVVAATEVDHITPLRDGGTHDEDNLQALCKSCHSHKTATENGGWGRS